MAEGDNVLTTVELCEAVERERRRQKISIEALVRRAGYSKTTYYRWRKEPWAARSETAVCFLRAVGLKLTLSAMDV
jgi:hypothetical protein